MSKEPLAEFCQRTGSPGFQPLSPAPFSWRRTAPAASVTASITASVPTSTASDGSAIAAALTSSGSGGGGDEI